MRRISLILILLVAALVLAFALVHFSSTATAPVALGIQSYSQGSAVVVLTNRSGGKVDYLLKIERRIGDAWPTYPQGIPVGVDSGQPGSLAVGQVASATLPVMVYAPPYPWRVSVFCYRNPPWPNSVRFKVGLWLLRLHLTKLARKAFGETETVQVSGPPMQQ